MSGSIKHADDGFISLYIDGDLQFDSKDEYIYHEGLVLPALALASQRFKSPLNVLIIGGGDGLVARELFKSQQIQKIDLVDYDPQILAHAQTDFAQINKSSLSDPRLSIHIEDAWHFVDRAFQSNTNYNLIIVDLTVPDDANSARFHSIDWYSKLSRLLLPEGIISINGVSALKTPQAFWSIFNSVSKVNLFVRPYHVQIPSFIAQDFGPDWGFFIASNQMITIDEFTDNLNLVKPREYITDIQSLLNLFVFSKELFAYQPSSVPALAGSDVLIQYFNEDDACTTSGDTLSSLSFNCDIASIPEPDSDKSILPVNLSKAIAKMNGAENLDPNVILDDIVQLMPSLQRQCSPELVADFVQNPIYFLEGIDLQEIVSKLLQRAKELPAQLVNELELLRDKLQQWASEELALVTLGQRVLTVLTLVIIVGNLLYPDSVYGKGEHGGKESAHAHHGGRGRNGGWVNGNYVGNPNPYWTNTNTRYINQKPAPYVNRKPAAPQEIIVKPGKSVINKNTSGSLPLDNKAPSSAYLSILERNVEASKNRLLENLKNILSQKKTLENELKQYQISKEELVLYGVHKIEKAEAMRRTQLTIISLERQIKNIDNQLNQIPSIAELTKFALSNLELSAQNSAQDLDNEES